MKYISAYASKPEFCVGVNAVNIETAHIRVKAFYCQTHPVQCQRNVCVNILTNETCNLIARSQRIVVTSFDICNMQHGYSRYLPTTVPEFLYYWRSVHGVLLEEDDERVEIMTASGPRVVPEKVLVRSVGQNYKYLSYPCSSMNIMRFRTRTQAEKIAKAAIVAICDSPFVLSAKLMVLNMRDNVLFERASERHYK